jgi:hypothetical protein
MKYPAIISHCTQNRTELNLLLSDATALLVIAVVVVAFSLCHG